MTYDVLVDELALRARVNPEVVREILFQFPGVLVQMGEGDSVRTPMGVFRMTRSRTRPILLPDRATAALVPSKLVVKLRSGSRLRGQATPPSAKMTG